MDADFGVLDTRSDMHHHPQTDLEMANLAKRDVPPQDEPAMFDFFFFLTFVNSREPATPVVGYFALEECAT